MTLGPILGSVLFDEIGFSWLFIILGFNYLIITVSLTYFLPDIKG